MNIRKQFALLSTAALLLTASAQARSVGAHQHCRPPQLRSGQHLYAVFYSPVKHACIAETWTREPDRIVAVIEMRQNLRFAYLSAGELPATLTDQQLIVSLFDAIQEYGRPPEVDER